jgi:hypothetical protein
MGVPADDYVAATLGSDVDSAYSVAVDGIQPKPELSSSSARAMRDQRVGVCRRGVEPPLPHEMVPRIEVTWNDRVAIGTLEAACDSRRRRRRHG